MPNFAALLHKTAKMIIDFSVQNFGPIKSKQTLSFEADKSGHLEDYYVVEAGGLRLLKLALIYGANASGKTTLLKALEFLKGLALYPVSRKTDAFDFNPFLFDRESLKQESVLSIRFIQNGLKYDYEVAFNHNAITREILCVYNPRKAVVFERTTDFKQQLTSIVFRRGVKKNKIVQNTLEANTLWNNTVLGGFIKTNIELPELKEVTDWFDNYLGRVIFTQTSLDNYVTRGIRKQRHQ